VTPQQAEQRKRRGGGEARKLRGRVGQPRVGRKGVDTRELRKACNECSGHLVWHAERAQVVHGRARHAVGVGVVQRGRCGILSAARGWCVSAHSESGSPLSAQHTSMALRKLLRRLLHVVRRGRVQM
jgi:hypothetical protein